MRLVKVLISFIVLTLSWSCVCLYGALNGWWLTPLAKQGDSAAFIARVQQRFLNEAKGNFAMVIIEDGRVVSKQFTPSINSVNGDTLFPVASMSKLFTAYGVYQLAQQGDIGLDAPISNYLTAAWQLPASSFNHNKITLRSLLSHTSGLTDGLGFADISKSQPMPSLIESLNHPKGARGDVKLEIGFEPATQWQYSGGGYLITEHIIENVTKMSFEDFMAKTVFSPLSMYRANYAFIDTHSNVANPYDSAGKKAPFYQYVSPAATGLLASTNDLTQFVLALQQTDKHPQNAINTLSKPLGHKLGAPIWGMGAMLYAPLPDGKFILGHDGANEPAINSALRLNPTNHDAIIVLASGGENLATAIASEWTFWQAGIPDFLTFERAIRSAFLPIALGVVVILLALALVYRKRVIST